MMAPPSVLGPSGLSEPDKGPVVSTIHVPHEPVEAVAVTEDLYDDSTIKTVDELVRRRARTNPDGVIVSYPSSGIDYVDYTMRQLDVYAFRVAKFYQQHIPMRQSSEEKPKVVALLGPSNFEYLVTMLALTKLGHTTLFLSTRISQEAVDNLIRVTGAQLLLAHPRHFETAEAAKQSLPHLDILDIAGKGVYDFPIEIHADTRMDYALDHEIEASHNIYIIHSSGSTGLPKPIYQTQKSAVANYVFSMEMKALITLPLYHNHGICNLFRAIYCGKSIHLYNADLPLTHDYLVKIMKTHHFEIFYGVPYALKLLSETPEGIAQLQALKIVMYGGSACPDDLGNMLVQSGVNLIGHYGSTEVGQLMTSFRPEGDNAWNYVREHPKLAPFLRWIQRGPNLFESCVLPGWPAKVDSNQPDGSYLTKDLFEPHPTIQGAWKYIARRDDTINLVNGEMFNPVSTEGTIRSNKNVTEVVIFGAGRPSLGALIVPSASLADKNEEEALDTLWPVVESACQNVEAYAKITKDMIKVLPWDCPYPRTDKGSIIRQAFYRTYEREINELYDRAETASGDLKKLDLLQTQDFIRDLVLEVLAKKVEMDDDTDFFSIGLDSLQAIRIRGTVLRNLDVGGHRLGQTMVFDHPSITKLSTYLYGLSSGVVEAAQEKPIESDMNDMINKYSIIPSPLPPRSSVVVTGVTGSLGAHIVAKLAVDPTITTIYCLVRAKSDAEAKLRITGSLMQRKVYHNLPLPHREKLVALASDLSDSKLGLVPDVYDRIREDLRLVIHSAWSVNFNMRLSSFESSNIAGATHLISLCHAAGPEASFNFCSSVSTVARATVSPVPESVPDLEWAQGMGYGQSKNVTEHICHRVAAEYGVPSRVLRLGQIVADTEHGVWNATEAIPLMIQSALTVGALPKLQETPSWLPVDTIAQAVCDISFSDKKGSVFTNVTNPKTFSWTGDLLPALKACGLQFEEVEPKEWVRRLRASNPDPEANPPIKLVDFFASKYDKDEFAPSKEYATETACSLSPALASAPVLSQDLVKKFVTYFQQNHWKKSTGSPAPVPSASAADGSGSGSSSVENETSRSETKTIIVVAGPCGSGKSTVANSLASQLGFSSIEGDSLHSKASIDKMTASVALTNDDRAKWLARIGARAIEAVTDMGYDGAVVTCSALKRQYRDVLRAVLTQGGRQDEVKTKLVFLDLQCSPELLVERMRERKGHYMQPEMVDGQVAAYERPEVDEVDILPLNASGTTEEVLSQAKWLLDHA